MIIADENIGIEFERGKHWESVHANLFLVDQTVLATTEEISTSADDELFPVPESDGPSWPSPILKPNPFRYSRDAATWNRKERRPFKETT
jgi:hypothetical protein